MLFLVVCRVGCVELRSGVYDVVIGPIFGATYPYMQMNFSVLMIAFRLVGFVIGSACFKDSKSSLSGEGFVTSESYKFSARKKPCP